MYLLKMYLPVMYLPLNLALQLELELTPVQGNAGNGSAEGVVCWFWQQTTGAYFMGEGSFSSCLDNCPSHAMVI